MIELLGWRGWRQFLVAGYLVSVREIKEFFGIVGLI